MSGYDTACVTYSPDGRLYQIEYAMKAVESRNTSVGIQCKDGIILGAEKNIITPLLVEGTGRRVAPVSFSVGACIAGYLPDGQQIMKYCERIAKSFKSTFGESAPPEYIVNTIGKTFHDFTTYNAYRPWGTNLMIAGYDEVKHKPELYMIEPSGTRYKYFGCCAGKGAQRAKSEIEKAKFLDKTCMESLNLLAKILYQVHESEKPVELELGWISEGTEWKFQTVPKELREAACEWAKESIEHDEMGDDAEMEED